MEIDPDDYEIGDFIVCDHCGATHDVVGVDDEDHGIKYELVEEDK